MKYILATFIMFNKIHNLHIIQVSNMLLVYACDIKYHTLALNRLLLAFWIFGHALIMCHDDLPRGIYDIG